MMIDFLLALLIIVAVLALRVRDLLASVILASAFSLVSCLLFLLLAAPDVALTEAAVGTGVGTVVFIWIVFKTQRKVAHGTRG
jgi:uncharacterized MnhB-related membrane protein